MDFYSLRTGEVTKKTKNKKKLKNFHTGYVGSFYQNLPIILILLWALISMIGSPMILVFPQKIFRNISLQPVILARECKQI